jgi:integrase
VALDHDIIPSFGDWIVQSVSHADVQRWVNDLAKRVSPASVRRTFVILAQLFVLAEDHELGTSPARRIRLPRIERDEMRFLTPAELDRLADAVGLRWRAMVLLMAFATLRIGEATGLRRRDIDPMHRRVQIANNIVEVGHQLHEGPPKTRAGRRTMSLPNVVMTAVEDHLDCFAGESYVFPWDDGGPLRAEEWRRTIWRPAVASTGLAPLRPHDLKHTGVAFLIAAGVDPSEIARRAGHTSVTTTYDLYGHLLPEIDTDAADRLDHLWERLASSPMAQEWHGERPLSEGNLAERSVSLVKGSAEVSSRGALGSTPDAQECQGVRVDVHVDNLRTVASTSR